MKNILEDIGLYSWQDQECVILCALLADYPILLYGAHGQSKTRGAEAIARSFLGADIVFQPHDYSRMNKEELVGVLDPKGLQQGQLRWLPTPTSVWGADAMLFDEFTFGNIMMGSMVHELLTHKTVMGQPTKVKLAMAACNPPDAYAANYLNLATCSRFILIKVPAYEDISEASSNAILTKEDSAFSSPPPLLKELIEEARTRKPVEADHKFASDILRVTRKVLKRYSAIKYSMRQEKTLYRLCLALRQLDKADYMVSWIGDCLRLIVSTIPELSPLVAVDGKLQSQGVEQQIKLELQEIFKGSNLLALANKSTITDPHAWAYEILENAANATVNDLRGAIQALAKREDISTDIYNALLCSLYKLLLPDIKIQSTLRPLKVTVKNLKTVLRQVALV